MPEDPSPTLAGRMAAAVALFVLLGGTLLQIYRVGVIDDTRVRSFAYTQDKAYQHLVIGRELVEGTTQSGPQHFGGTTPLAASASPGWSIAMAFALGLPSLSREAGRDLDEIALVPLAINFAAAALIVAIAGHLVRREVRGGAVMLGFLIALGLLIPLPLLVMSGMEHLTHMVIVLLTVAVGLRSVDRADTSIGLVVLAALLTAINVSLRYESLAVLLALLLWAWIQRRSGREVFSVLAGLGVVAAVGMYLSGYGASVLPNPVLVHAGMVLEAGEQHWLAGLFDHVLLNLRQATLPWALLLMGAALLASSRGRTHSPDPLDRSRVGWLFVFVVTGFLHLLVGQSDEHGFRHTAYLIPLGAVAIARSLGATYHSDLLTLLRPAGAGGGLSERMAVITPAVRPWSRGSGLIALAAMAPVIVVAAPAVRGFVDAPQAVRDAYVRERVAASFVRTFWSDGPVAANSTGLLGYETHARLVDLSGWANHDLAVKRYEGQYGADLIAQEVAQAGAQIALLMGNEEQIPVPRNWKQVGGWYRQGADRNSKSAVQVFSVIPALEHDVQMALRLFSEQRREGIDFWFIEDDAAPSTRPGAVQWSEAGEHKDWRAG